MGRGYGRTPGPGEQLFHILMIGVLGMGFFMLSMSGC